MLNKRYIKSIKRDIFGFDFLSSILVSIFFCYILVRKEKKWFKHDIIDLISSLYFFCFDFFSGKYWKRNVPSGVP